MSQNGYQSCECIDDVRDAFEGQFIEGNIVKAKPAFMAFENWERDENDMDDEY